MSRLMLVLGIVFSVLSIFISYYAINNNHETIESLNAQIYENESQINQFWQKQQELEQRHGISIMLYALVADKQETDVVRHAAESYVKDTLEFYELSNNNVDYDHIIEVLPEKLKEARFAAIDRIDDLYAEKVLLETKITEMKKTNGFYKFLGLLMQVIGLVLVLYFRP